MNTAFDPTDFMSADIDALWTRDPEQRGPTLITLGMDLEKLPLCGFCPMARWYVRDQKLQAFCKEYRESVYPSEGEGVSLCDGYVIASDRIKGPSPEA